jgi:hypothetical protein
MWRKVMKWLLIIEKQPHYWLPNSKDIKVLLTETPSIDSQQQTKFLKYFISNKIKKQLLLKPKVSNVQIISLQHQFHFIIYCGPIKTIFSNKKGTNYKQQWNHASLVNGDVQIICTKKLR